MKVSTEMNPRCLSALLFVGALFVCIFLLENCKSTSTQRPQREPIAISDTASVLDMCNHANDVAEEGYPICKFRFSDSKIVTLEFPLLDNNIRHWQFKVIQDFDLQSDDLTTRKTSDAFVIFATCGLDGWRIGRAPVSEVNLEKQIKGYASKHPRTVLVIRTGRELPAKRLKHIWHAAQSAGVRVVIHELEPKPDKS